MTAEGLIFRDLQKHLDRQAVGFPATKSGVEIRFLMKLFTPEEARLALFLSYRPAPTEAICLAAAPQFTREQTERLLIGMHTKGAIGWKEKEGVSHWFVYPMVIGMYEAQDGHINPRIQTEANAYTRSKSFGMAFLAASPSQMRTIPLNISVPAEHHIASYDQLRKIVETASGPFGVLKCICRENAAWQGRSCKKTTRSETCLGFGHMAASVLRRKNGREISKDELLSILQQNENDGLVLQPSNAQNPAFVCSCCGCCCGMLAMQKLLPHPVDFWTTNFHAAVDGGACKSCGKCVARCQVNAVTLAGSKKTATVNLSRCIGCGVCVPTCASHAIRLVKNAVQTVPPADEEELYDRIMARKKGAWQKSLMAVKLMLGMRQ